MGEKVKVMKLKGYNPFNSYTGLGGVPELMPQVIYDKLQDSPWTILPSVSLQIKGRLSYYNRSHLGPYFTAASTDYKPDNITSVNSIRSL